jgi:hypothetical protein
MVYGHQRPGRVGKREEGERLANGYDATFRREE